MLASDGSRSQNVGMLPKGLTAASYGPKSLPGQSSAVALGGLVRLLRSPVDAAGPQLGPLADALEVDVDAVRAALLGLETPPVLGGGVDQRDVLRLA
jgi:hypothetical protein